jgi:hypothetical protein
MTAPPNARDALEGACDEDRCTWWPWAELAECTECGAALCGEHAPDHSCPEAAP